MARTLVESDLVKDSKLETIFGHGYTVHTYDVSGETQRKIRRKERWKKEEELGKGGFGTVWRETLVTDTGIPRERAVKKIQKRADYVRELEAIAKFSHAKYVRCFVQSFGWYELHDQIYIAMEYLRLGSLEPRLTSPLPEQDTKQITFQILEGLLYMHENGFVHRDLKPSNILIKSAEPDWWVKIADFGISKRAEGGEGTASLQTVTGTFGFIAPEVLVQNNIIQNPGFEFREEYKTAVDMWSLGVIVYQALTGKKPFPTAQGEYIGALREYVKGGSFLSLPMDISSDGLGFLRALLRPTPKDRLRTRDALSHSWIAPPKTSSENELDDIERPEPTTVGTTTSKYQIPDPSAAWSSEEPSDTRGDVPPKPAIKQKSSSPVTAKPVQNTPTRRPEESKGNVLVEFGRRLGVLPPSYDDKADDKSRPHSRGRSKPGRALASSAPTSRHDSPRSSTPSLPSRGKDKHKDEDSGYSEPMARSSTPSLPSRRKKKHDDEDSGYSEPMVPGLPAHKQPVIRQVDMNDKEMIQKVFIVARIAMDKFSVDTQIAGHIKRQFDQSYGSAWHCIVGTDFGSYVTHETGYFIYFRFQHREILLWKTL